MTINTTADMVSQINTLVADNNSRQITPAVLRNVLTMLAAMQDSKQAAILPAALIANAAANANTSLVTILLSDVLAANNVLATKYNDLATKFNTLLADLKAQGLMSAT